MGIFRSTAVMQHSVIGGVGTNTWHFRTIGFSEADDLARLNDATEALGVFYESLAGIYPDGLTVSFDGEWLQVDEEGPVVTGDPFTTVTGTGGDPTPPVLAIVVAWGTSLSAKRHRGRTFLGPLGAELLDGSGTPPTGILTVVRNAADALLLSNVGFADGSFCVWSAHSLGNTPAAFDFTRRTVHDKFASLRSRRD